MGKKIVLNDSGIAILGNAMLLGCLSKQNEPLSRRATGDGRRARRFDRSECRELKDALFAAELLDDRIARAVDMSGDRIGDGLNNRDHRLSEIIASDAEIAAVRFGDFLYSDVESARYRIADALATTEDIELQTPIARLDPSDLVERVRRLVVDYAKDRAALELGLTEAEAGYIGLEGLVTRRELKKPPEWRQWNSASARRTRRDAGWLQEMRQKARRHVLRPLEQAYASSLPSQDLAQLGVRLEQLGPSIRNGDLTVHDGLNALASHLCHGPAVSEEIMDQLFPSYGAMQERNYRADADPFNVLVFMSAQVAWHAVKEGWALCLAEDGLEGDCLSWVPPDAFPKLSDSGELALPDEIGVSGCLDLDQRARTALGAEKLWFVLTNDAVEVLGLPDHPVPKDTKESKKKRKYNEGFTVLDAPFVAEGLRMLETGGAKSALDAAKILIAKYGVFTKPDWTPGRTEIRSLSRDGAERRLQKAISKAWKTRDR